MNKEELPFRIIMYSLAALLFWSGFNGVTTGELRWVTRSGIVVERGNSAIIVGLICMIVAVFFVDIASGLPIQSQFEKLGKMISKYINKE